MIYWADASAQRATTRVKKHLPYRDVIVRSNLLSLSLSSRVFLVKIAKVNPKLREIAIHPGVRRLEKFSRGENVRGQTESTCLPS